MVLAIGGARATIFTPPTPAGSELT